MTFRRDDDDEPVRRSDPRVRGAMAWRETTVAAKRKQKKTHSTRVLERTGPRRARMASHILLDLGDEDCPAGVAPSAGLFREARKALGWKQGEAAWRLGFASRSPAPIGAIETGRRFAPRHARLLLMAALKRLAAVQKRMSHR